MPVRPNRAATVTSARRLALNAVLILVGACGIWAVITVSFAFSEKEFGIVP